jgi:hypothetical protein
VKADSRPKTYCSRACQKQAANATSNARRPSTGNPPGRPRKEASRNPKADGVTLAPPTPRRPSAVNLEAPLSHSQGPCGVGDRIRLWLDHSALGSGERYLIVAEFTRARVILFSAAAMISVSVSRQDFEKHASPYQSDPQAVLNILARNLASYQRASLLFDTPPESVIRALTIEASSSTKELAA